MSANDALFFGFGKHIHDALVTLDPIAFGEAVHKAYVDIVSAKFASETVEVGASGGGVARPRFGEPGDSIARDMLERIGNVRLAAVRIGRVKEAQAGVVANEQQVGEAPGAEGTLRGIRTEPEGAGACGGAGR